MREHWWMPSHDESGEPAFYCELCCTFSHDRKPPVEGCTEPEFVARRIAVATEHARQGLQEEA